jgi:hypoxanthine phosphoribosyltransferase
VTDAELAPPGRDRQSGGPTLAAESNTATGVEAATGPDPATGPDTRFAHASEAEMARILDFYGVAWDYEPVTFPILWNLEGDVVESFAPDFYLPDFDIFLEMTTLKQRLVRKKNRKLRRLRALYPDIRIKLFYARDFRAMMLKYGRLGLVRSLSGTPGQVVPERAAAIEPIVGDDALEVEPAVEATATPRARARRRGGSGAAVAETEVQA